MINLWLSKLAEVPLTDEQELEQSLADLPNGELLELAFSEGVQERPTETQTLQEKIAVAKKAGVQLAHEYGWNLKKEALIPGVDQALSTVAKAGSKVLSHPAARVGMGALNAKGKAQGISGIYQSFKTAAMADTLRTAGQGVARGIHNNPWLIPAGAAAAGTMLAPNDREGHKDYLPGAMVAGGLGLGAYYGLGGKQGIQDRIAGTGDYAGKPLFGQEAADVATMPKEQYQQMRQAAKAQAQGTPPQGAPSQHVAPQSESLFAAGMDKMHDPSLSSIMPSQQAPVHSGMVQVPQNMPATAATPAQSPGGFSQALHAQKSPAGAAPAAAQQTPAHLQGPSPWREQTGGFSRAMAAGGAPPAAPQQAGGFSRAMAAGGAPDPAAMAQQARAAQGAQLSPAAAARKQEVGMRLGRIQRPQPQAGPMSASPHGYQLVGTGAVPIQHSPLAAAGRAVAHAPSQATQVLKKPGLGKMVSKMIPGVKLATPLQKAAMVASFHKVAMMSPFGMGASGGATGAKYNTGGVIASSAPPQQRFAPSAPQPSSVMASSSRPAPRPTNVPPPIPADAISKKPFTMQSVASRGSAPATSTLGVAGKAVSTPKLPGVMGALRPR